MGKDTRVRSVAWEELPREELNALLGRRIITGENVMLAHVYLKEGCIVPMHQHENEQLTYILDGETKFWIGSEESEPVSVKAVEVLVIPSNTPHKAQAVVDTLDLDVFSPPRQDWLAKTDDYLRK